MAKVIEVVAGIALIGAALAFGPIGIGLFSSMGAFSTMISIGATTALAGTIGLFQKSNPVSLSGGQVNVTQAISYRRIIYGKFQCAGVLTFIDFPGGSGSDQDPDAQHEHLHAVYTIAGHQITKFITVVVDGISYGFGTDITYNGTSGYWEVSNPASPYYQRLSFEFSFGAPAFAGQPFSQLESASLKWTSSTRQQGRAAVHVDMRYDKTDTTLYVGGRVPTFEFLVIGKKVADPRVLTSWEPLTGFLQYMYIIDEQGYVWMQTNASGTSGSSEPPFTSHETLGATLSDGGMNWQNVGLYSDATANIGPGGNPGGYLNPTNELVCDGWAASTTFPYQTIIEAPVGYLQLANHVGGTTTGTTYPSFGLARGVLTTDNGVAGAWLCLGRSPNADAFPSPAIGLPGFRCSNPALIINDWLQNTDWGMAADPATIDMSTVIAAANICDEQVLVEWLSGGGQLYEALYSANGMYDESSIRGDVLKALCVSMAGFAVPPGDAWRMYAGAYNTPTVTLTDVDFRDSIKGDFRISRRDICNGVRGTFIPSVLPIADNGPLLSGPNPAWQWTDFPAFQKASYITEDGGQIIWKDIKLDFTTSIWAAQRLAKWTLETLRRQQTFHLPCKLSAFQLQAGDTVWITHSRWGITSGSYQVVQVSLVQDITKDSPAIGVDLVLRQIDANVYQFTAPASAGDFGEYSPYGSTGTYAGGGSGGGGGGGADFSRPTTYSDLGDNPTTNPTYAYDTNLSTESNVQGFGDQVGECHWFGIVQPVGTVSDLVLNIDTSCTAHGPTGVAVVYYSLNNGASYTALYSTHTGRARTRDTISLPSGQDFTKVIVKVHCSGNGTDASFVSVFDINLQYNLH